MTEKEDKPVDVETPGQVCGSTFLEQIKTGAGFAFAAHEQMGDGSWRDDTVSYVSHAGKRLVPMKCPPWPLAGTPVDYGSDKDLVNEMQEFWKYHHEIRDNRAYTVLACWILATYRTEQFNIIPYLDFLGPKGTGKTRALELLSQLAYRGCLVTHPTPAVVFRLVDRYTPTLLADNYEFWPEGTRNDLDGLFNAGYRRGVHVYRCPREGEGNGSDLLVFKVFCPKALAGTREPVDSLASRCIMIRMSRNQKEKPVEVDTSWGERLRSCLLTYRFRNLEGATKIELQ
jgi:hypothetical protein